MTDSSSTSTLYSTIIPSIKSGAISCEVVSSGWFKNFLFIYCLGILLDLRRFKSLHK